ncbi:hypothetical protein HUJ04_012869 [Dendroctonus ponderosae]|nr:hypothetical protein HUJ04_012869 [Dendroctonus ponderosae]
MSGYNRLTVQQMADILENEDFWADNPIEKLFITPPEVKDFSDENSGDENTGGMLDNFSRNQLEAEAEEGNYSTYRDMNAEQLKELVSDDEVVNFLVDESIMSSGRSGGLRGLKKQQRRVFSAILDFKSTRNESETKP